MDYTKKERERYNARRTKACEQLQITINQYNYLRRKGEELRKVYANNCNGEYKTEEESNLAENKVKMAIWQYRLKNKNLQELKWYFQTDPRGTALYVDREPIPKNNYTRAICIY